MMEDNFEESNWKEFKQEYQEKTYKEFCARLGKGKPRYMFEKEVSKRCDVLGKNTMFAGLARTRKPNVFKLQLAARS